MSLDGSDWPAFLSAVRDDDRAEAARLDAPSPDALSDIMFTSGTTGDPKGAMADHRQTVRTAIVGARHDDRGRGTVSSILWPFFHCSGYKAGWVVNLAVGATTIPDPVLDTARLLQRTSPRSG
ncbi:AMP-binding protein [Sphingomonas sp. MMS24-JH45]